MVKLKNNKGFTIVELIMALSIFSMIMLPVFYGFATAAKINKLSAQQIKINTAVKHIKERVPEYFKKPSLQVPQYQSGNTVNKVSNSISSKGNVDNIAIEESSGNYSKEYKYQLTNRGSVLDTAEGKTYVNAFKYEVILKKLDGTKVLSFNIYIND